MCFSIYSSLSSTSTDCCGQASSLTGQPRDPADPTPVAICTAVHCGFHPGVDRVDHHIQEVKEKQRHTRQEKQNHFNFCLEVIFMHLANCVAGCVGAGRWRRLMFNILESQPFLFSSPHSSPGSALHSLTSCFGINTHPLVCQFKTSLTLYISWT